jgi:hypothetical protein
MMIVDMKRPINKSKFRQLLRSHRNNATTSVSLWHGNAVEYLKKSGVEIGNMRKHAAQLVASGALASTLVLGAPIVHDMSKNPSELIAELPLYEREKEFSAELKTHLVGNDVSLTLPQEIIISKLVHDYWGIHATPVLEGKRLNHSYAFMGYEQHLHRYPGDTVSQHDEYQGAGIAPGKGAWGYFANSKDELTDDLIQKEKYYVAVQTLYLSDWNANWSELKEWYKYRKVVVVNPENGKTVIASVADAGPARWTGKQFGGSPEVMEYLGLVTGKKKGKVILFFVNDPHDSIALGPVGYNERKDLAQK